MSTTDTEGGTREISEADVTPVTVAASALDSTAPGYLRDLKYDLASQGRAPARLTVTASFEEDCSLATQEEAERLRGYVRAASFLGAGRLTVEVTEVADAEKVRPALRACAERARREGVVVDVDGPVAI